MFFPNKISSNSLKISNLEIKAISMEILELNLISFQVNENLEFYKIEFNKEEIPQIKPVIIKNNSSKINLKRIVCQNKNENEIILDIAILKNIRQNFLFISGFEYPKNSKSPNKDSININTFIQYSYNNCQNIFDSIKITTFYDIYYPDDIYDFQSKPIIDLLYFNYQEK